MSADAPLERKKETNPGEITATPQPMPPPPRCDFRLICPNCGAAMFDRSCKTRCSRCHFFTDCSDPW